MFFFFNDTATTEIYTLSLHDALPISPAPAPARARARPGPPTTLPSPAGRDRSEEHTSELQSPCNLVCRLLLEKKKNIHHVHVTTQPRHKLLLLALYALCHLVSSRLSV